MVFTARILRVVTAERPQGGPHTTFVPPGGSLDYARICERAARVADHGDGVGQITRRP
jgi:hypothetical protein